MSLYVKSSDASLRRRIGSCDEIVVVYRLLRAKQNYSGDAA
jgi:hypothetical protein